MKPLFERFEPLEPTTPTSQPLQPAAAGKKGKKRGKPVRARIPTKPNGPAPVALRMHVDQGSPETPAREGVPERASKNSENMG